jgi:serine/threonine protein kinase
LQKGALSLPESIKIGVQLVDALDKAHRSGVHHPETRNVILTTDGAKLVDFGFGETGADAEPRFELVCDERAHGGASWRSIQPNLPARTILGTLHYWPRNRSKARTPTRGRTALPSP